MSFLFLALLWLVSFYFELNLIIQVHELLLHFRTLSWWIIIGRHRPFICSRLLQRHRHAQVGLMATADHFQQVTAIVIMDTARLHRGGMAASKLWSNRLWSWTIWRSWLMSLVYKLGPHLLHWFSNVMWTALMIFSIACCNLGYAYLGTHACIRLTHLISFLKIAWGLRTARNVVLTTLYGFRTL